MVASVSAGRRLIGAGTVLTAAEVDEVADAGGRWSSRPNCDPEVIRATKDSGMQSWPGVLTPTECFAALQAGADGLKIFPGDLLGPEGLKAIRAVLPHGHAGLCRRRCRAGELRASGSRPGPTGSASARRSTRPGWHVAECRRARAEIVAAYDAGARADERAHIRRHALHASAKGRSGIPARGAAVLVRHPRQAPPDRRSGETRQWQFDEHVSAAGWVDRDTLLIASRDRALPVRHRDRHARDAVPLEADRPVTRSNDGRADP